MPIVIVINTKSNTILKRNFTKNYKYGRKKVISRLYIPTKHIYYVVLQCSINPFSLDPLLAHSGPKHISPSYNKRKIRQYNT